MKARYIVALVLALTATQAHGKVIATSANNARGVIALTDTKVDICGDDAAVVYSTSPVNPTVYGCWWYDERMIHVTYDNFQTTYSYGITTFTVVE